MSDIQYDFDDDGWLMFTPDSTDDYINERFAEVFGRLPATISPADGSWRYAGPVTETEEDSRRTKK